MEEALSGGWVRFENVMPESLKVAPVGDKAFRLWVHAICYCSRARTDGRIPAAVITGLSATANARTVTELLDAGLVERLDERTYLVHDYLDYNPSRARVDEMREQTKGRVAKHRGNGDVTALHGASGNDVTSHARDRTVTDPILSLLCQRLATRIRENDPKADPRPESERWLTDMRLLLADRGGDAGEVERIVDWCQADPFWRSNILSPGKLRKQFTQLVLKATVAPTADGTNVVALSRRERVVNDRNRFIDHD